MKSLKYPNKSRIPWNKGLKGIVKHSEETKKRMSISAKNSINSGRFKKGYIPWHKGKSGYHMKPCSEERKRKIGLANSIALKGKIQSIESRMKKSIALREEKNHQWEGGITPKNFRIRNSIDFRLWREVVFAKDNYTCQKYGIRGQKGFGKRVVLHPHHIQNFADFPELRFEVSNGITLSEKAHKEFHKKYGHKNNTKEQLEEFLNI